MLKWPARLSWRHSGSHSRDPISCSKNVTRFFISIRAENKDGSIFRFPPLIHPSSSLRVRTDGLKRRFQRHRLNSLLATESYPRPPGLRALIRLPEGGTKSNGSSSLSIVDRPSPHSMSKMPIALAMVPPLRRRGSGHKQTNQQTKIKHLAGQRLTRFRVAPVRGNAFGLTSTSKHLPPIKSPTVLKQFAS